MAALTRRFAARMIQTAALIAAAFAVVATIFDPAPARIAESLPAVLDRGGEPLAVFASHARHAVLPGSTYTVSVRDPRQELELWRAMLAFSSRRTPVPPDDPRADEARFVVTYGSKRPPERGLQYVVSFGDGTVWERPQ